MTRQILNELTHEEDVYYIVRDYKLIPLLRQTFPIFTAKRAGTSTAGDYFMKFLIENNQLYLTELQIFQLDLDDENSTIGGKQAVEQFFWHKISRAERKITGNKEAKVKTTTGFFKFSQLHEFIPLDGCLVLGIPQKEITVNGWFEFDTYLCSQIKRLTFESGTLIDVTDFAQEAETVRNILSTSDKSKKKLRRYAIDFERKIACPDNE